MGFLDGVGAVNDGLQERLVRAFVENQQREQMALQQARLAQDEEQFQRTMRDRSEERGVRMKQDAADNAYRQGQVERQGRLDDVAAGERRQDQNAVGVRRMIGDFLVQRGAQPLDGGARQTLQGMALQEGVNLPANVATDPEEPHRRALDLENLRHKNDMEQVGVQGKQRMSEIGAQGQNTLAAATARTAGTRDAATQRRIDSQAKGFDANPVVKRAQAMSEAAVFAKGLDPKTTNPADDQALIYNFAKSMDPDSAVREGEYATIQKYAQSMAERFGFNAARVFSNTTFLTPEARANLKATILSRYKATRGQYDSTRKAYADKVAGMGGDESDLIDYGAGFPSLDEPSEPPSGGPAVGDTRTINGVQAVWDGKGWKKAQ